MNSKIEHDDNYGCAPFFSKEIEALRNLRGNPAFQLVGIGNPALYDDPHTVFVEPKTTMETELDDDYRTAIPETRQEELLHAETEARREAIARLVDGDDPEFEKAFLECGYFFSTRELDIAALFWYLARQR